MTEKNKGRSDCRVFTVKMVQKLLINHEANDFTIFFEKV